MDLEQLRSELNIVKQAKKYGIPLWQHPQFLFLVMGILIVLSSILSWVLGRRYIEDPLLAALFIITLTLILLILAFIITRSFERLAEASRLKTEFVSIVSHQLRAPLSNMKWIAEVLNSGKGNNHQKEYFQLLEENSSRMQELVNDLLTVSRIEEGGLGGKKKSFSLQELVRGVLKDFEHVSRAANITLVREGDEKLPPVLADPLQIRQVLSNLVDNAIQYTGKTDGAVPPSGGKERRVAVRYGRQGRNARFEIEDTGVGIPREDQKYIFQKFFRSENVRRHETQGSGLGLYIAKSIVRNAGGRMGFRSQERKGSTFWFTIPLAL